MRESEGIERDRRGLRGPAAGGMGRTAALAEEALEIQLGLRPLRVQCAGVRLLMAVQRLGGEEKGGAGRWPRGTGRLAGGARMRRQPRVAAGLLGGIWFTKGVGRSPKVFGGMSDLQSTIYFTNKDADG